MPNESTDWTNWIITSILGALSTMIATVVFLTKLIESKYIQEIRELKTTFSTFETKAEVKMVQLEDESRICQQDRFKLAVRVAQLESTSNNLERLTKSSEMKSMDRADLIKEQIKELEEKIKDKI